jgi:hypothetical protein
MNAEEFQLHVVDKLASLHTKMESLVGNGQPGRIGKLEAAVEELKKARWTIGGLVLGVSTVASFLFHYIFK